MARKPRGGILRSSRTLESFAGRHAIDIKVLTDLRVLFCPLFYRHEGPYGPSLTAQSSRILEILLILDILLQTAEGKPPHYTAIPASRYVCSINAISADDNPYNR